MQVVALIAAALCAPGPVAEPPAILIYWQPGMNGPGGPRMQPEIAVWKSGRVIWRDPAPVVYSNRGGRWGVQPAKYYEGKTEPKLVASSLRRLAQSGVFRLENWGYIVPDSHATRMTIRDGKRKVSFGSQDDPPPASYSRQSNWEQGLKAWNLTRKLAWSMVPNRKKEIPAPNIYNWF